jgi:succinylarginine dihydrolase
MTDDEIDACHQGVLLDEDTIDDLQEVVRKTYRDRLEAPDLADPEFANECRTAREALLEVLDLQGLA